MSLRYLALLFVALPFLVVAKTKKGTRHLSTDKYAIKATITDIPLQGILPIGFEYVIAKRVGVTAELAIPITLYTPYASEQYPTSVQSDMRYGADARFYFQKQKLKRANIDIQGFVGVSASYRTSRLIVTNGEVLYYGNLYRYPYGDIDRTESKMHIIIGMQMPIYKGLYFSLQGGAGIKRIEQQFRNEPQLPIYYRRVDRQIDFIGRESNWLYNSNAHSLTLPVAIRFGFRF